MIIIRKCLYSLVKVSMDKEINSMYYERKNLKNFDRQKSRRKKKKKMVKEI